jgi:predicted transposase YdaD
MMDSLVSSDAAADVLEIFTEMRLKREECREGGQDVKTAFQEILEDAREEGREEGREKGRREGAEWQLITLYKDNIIDYQTLVLRMNMSEAEVNKRLEEQTEE